MKFRDWILVYLATSSSFTRWAILAFYGGGLIVFALVVVAVVVLVGGRLMELLG